MKTRTKKILTTCCFSVLIISTITASFGWFLNNRDVQVTNNAEITAEGGNSLELRYKQVDGTMSGWTKQINMPAINATFEDITGDGLKLYEPKGLKTQIKKNDDGTLPPPGEGVEEYVPEELIPASPYDGQSSGKFLELEVELRSLYYLDIYFSEKSSILPKSINDKVVKNQDYIAGATRVAIFDKTGVADNNQLTKDNLKMIWIPNPQYKYNESTGKVDTSSLAHEFEDYRYLYPNGKAVEEYTYKDTEYASKQVVAGSTYANDKWIYNSPIITTLDPSKIPAESTNRYAQKTLLIRVWFEGTDREAVLDLSGGHVSVNLNLVGNNSKLNCPIEIRTLMNNIYVDDIAHVDQSIQNKVRVSNDGRNWEFFDTNKNDVQTIKDELARNHKVTKRNLFFKYEEDAEHMDYIVRIEFTKDNDGNINNSAAKVVSKVDDAKEARIEVTQNA